MSGTSKLAYVILTLAIGYAFIYPSVGDLSVLTEEKQKYENFLEMTGDIEAKKNELLSKFDAISDTDKKEIETILPNSLNLVKLVSDIDAVAARHGISINKISSKEVSSSVGNSIEGAAPQKSYQSSIVGFSFTATYGEFRSFMDDLGKSLRVLDIRSVRFGTQDNGVYSYSVEFETYWLQPA
jgi:hypothetical protein